MNASLRRGSLVLMGEMHREGECHDVDRDEDFLRHVGDTTRINATKRSCVTTFGAVLKEMS